MTTDASGTLDSLRVAGVDQLAGQRYLLTLGANSPGNPLTDDIITDFFPLASAAADEDANQIVVVFASTVARVTVTYTLTGGPLAAAVDYTTVVDVIDSSGFTLVDNVDFDLMNSPSDDTIVFTMPDTIAQSGNGASASARSITPFDFFDVGTCCFSDMIGRDIHGHLANGAGPVGAADVSGGFQINITTANGQSRTLLGRLEVTIPAGGGAAAPAPALAPLGIGLALALLLILGWVPLRRGRTA